MSIRTRRLIQQTWVRRLLLATFVVGLITTVLNLFLVGPELIGIPAGLLAVAAGAILDNFPKETR